MRPRFLSPQRKVILLTKLKNRKGSTSLLIILAFLMLIIFSVLAISSASADYRLAQRNANWTRDYYHLEGLVAEYRYQLDLLLYNENVINIDQIADIIRERDPEVFIEFTMEGMNLIRIFESDGGRRILLRTVLDYQMESFKVISLREIPIEFQYKYEIQFEDVEVRG